MAAEEVDAIGQGRVWLGETAHTLGLVDEIGGLRVAVERAKREAGLGPEVDPARMIFPGPRNLADQLFDLIQGYTMPMPWSGLDWLGLPEPLRGWLEALPGEPAYLPADWVEIR
jgi:protease-4